MSVQVCIFDNILIRGKDSCELERAVREGLAIRAYLKTEISIGELGELMGMEYADARDWLHKQGIATTRKLPPDLEKTANNNMERLAEKLGI
ncbi:MAG: hypothetical protein GY749_50780 [Desulfobacteraceae bacterium]|nr:hypothetical protein [Desulfobacteraceae bacterium]